MNEKILFAGAAIAIHIVILSIIVAIDSTKYPAGDKSLDTNREITYSGEGLFAKKDIVLGESK